MRYCYYYLLSAQVTWMKIKFIEIHIFWEHRRHHLAHVFLVFQKV